ncbi:MAG: hypothetical protein WC516_06255 [Patescibacteria group bacterium]|jgi:hypothetical protein
MRKIIILFGLCFILNGCSFLKIASAPLQATKNSVPQSINQSKEKIICSKNAVFNEDGLILSCGGKYYNYEQNKVQQDRKLTFWEKVGQVLSKTAGYIIWLAIIFGVLTFMGLGGLVVSFIQGATNIGKTGIKGIKQIMEAIQISKEGNQTLIDALEKSTDDDVKKWIADFKQKNGIK